MYKQKKNPQPNCEFFLFSLERVYQHAIKSSGPSFITKRYIK
jgi:hypothetical protein